MPLTWMVLLAAAGLSSAADRTAYVDDRGVLRWRGDDAELALFGVNYYAPFSLDYEGLAAAGEDHRRAIEHDVAHFARLGLDAIRLHVFDRQISDPQGNLLANEHLCLFDYLVSQAKRRGIYTVLTPMAWWPCRPNGTGFSARFPMPQMITDLEAREAQIRYLRQVLNHVNPYTGLAYKDEPAVVAIELINEPLYAAETTTAQITDYINALAGAVRATGARQPIFYNGWQDRERAVADARIEGCTFGWYPTGLVAGRSLRGNYLPLLDDFARMRLPCLERKAKIVYEFDAADAVSRCLYPAMARAFRSGGAQIATQFQYDPVALAHCNYGWQTHYLNLVYAPGKTVSFAIAAEAFRRTPRLAEPGRYPANAAFGPFRLSFEHDVSVLASDTAFYYSNDTDARPPALGSLTRIVGCGSSPLVRYEGTGAYFLDRIATGVWRLEVYPDAVWVDDPHAATSLDREVSRLIWARHPMTLDLPGLERPFHARRVAPGAGEATAAPDGAVTVTPGVYVLARDRDSLSAPVSTEFYAPASRRRDVAVWWDTPSRWRTGYDLPVRATVAAEGPRDVILHWRDAGGGSRQVPLTRTAPYQYAARLPAASLVPGPATAQIEVRLGDGRRTVQPARPDEEARQNALADPADICAVTPKTPAPSLSRQSAGGFPCSATVIDGKRLRVQADGFGPAPCATGFRLPAKAPAAGGYDTLAVRIRATAEATDRIELGLVQHDGHSYGCDLPLWPEWSDVRIPLRQLRPLWGTPAGRCEPQRLKEVSFVFGAWLYGDRRERAHGFEVERLWLEQTQPGWRISMDPADAPVELFSAGETPPPLNGQTPREASITRGRSPGKSALRVTTPGFQRAPSAIHFRGSVSPSIRQWKESLAACHAVQIVARATQPATKAVEIALVEADGAPWGTNVPLTTAWRTITVPFDELRYFSHWSHPPTRGGSNDRFQPTAIETVNVCFGAWLYGTQAAQPHGFELQSISLVPATGP